MDILKRWKRFIGGMVGAVAIVSVVVSFFLPKWYAARSSLLPPQSSDLPSTLSSLMQGFSLPGLGGVAPQSPEAQLYLAILDSRNLREQLVRKHDLQKVYRARTLDDALRAFSRLARCGLTDKGIVEVVVEDKNPARAAALANDWVGLLDDYNKNARMTAGRRSRMFVETRLTETKRALKAAEDTLAAYQGGHKNVALSADVTAAVSAGAEIIARRMALEVRLSYLRDLYTEGTPLVAQAEAELTALDRQIVALPAVALDYARLVRDLKVQEQVYALLVAQYEEARIRENKDTPTLDVLDVAVPAQRRVRPVRWLFCLSLTLAAALLSVGTAFAAEVLRRTDTPRPAETFPPSGRVGRSA